MNTPTRTHFRQETSDEFYTDERLYVTELMNHNGLADISLARCRVTPGTTTQLHSLSVTERYVIETGEGLMGLGSEKPFPVSAGDTVLIEAGLSQQITNTGKNDLVFLCVCTPRFTPDTYRNLE